jgi:glutathionylspermidine synthase
MKRESLIPRPDWASKMDDLGFHFHSIDGVYWDERACYRFTAAQIDTLEAATEELHGMCIEAAQHVIDNQLYARFAIPPEAVPMIEQSWNDDQDTLFGRFDVVWDGNGAPKMLEYNADTPTALIEASVAQWYWLQEVRPGTDQFNSLHEKLIVRWQEIAQHLASKRPRVKKMWATSTICAMWLCRRGWMRGLSMSVRLVGMRWQKRLWMNR